MALFFLLFELTAAITNLLGETALRFIEKVTKREREGDERGSF